jgi:hypothetical protein
MSCTRAELMSWLPGATRHSPFDVAGDTVTISIDGGSVEITLEQKLPRRAGLITLPVLDIAFRFIDLDDAARERFLAYFDLYTRRGGG